MSIQAQRHHRQQVSPPQRIRLDSLFLRPLNLAGYAYHLKKVPAYTWRAQLAQLASEDEFIFRSRVRWQPSNRTVSIVGLPRGLIGGPGHNSALSS